MAISVGKSSVVSSEGPKSSRRASTASRMGRSSRVASVMMCSVVPLLLSFSHNIDVVYSSGGGPYYYDCASASPCTGETQYCEQQQQFCEQHQQQHWAGVSSAPPPPPPQERLAEFSGPIPRGGSVATVASSSSSSTVTTPQMEDAADDGGVVDYNTIALALRMTCELNRQLCRGTDGATCAGGHCELVTDDGDNVYGSDVHVHPSQTWFHPIRRSVPSSHHQHYNNNNNNNGETERTPLTVFHAQAPSPISNSGSDSSSRKKRRAVTTGIPRWGPDLVSYLKHIQTILKCPPITFALALVYLDRACSAETQRLPIPNDHHDATATDMASSGPCPHLVPRTVHRLLLTAMILASKATKDEQTDEDDVDVDIVAKAFGISPQSLTTMEQWMLTALGELGTWVDHGRVYNLWNVWQRAFGHLHAAAGGDGTLGIGVPPRPAAAAISSHTHQDNTQAAVTSEEMVEQIISSSSSHQVVRIQRRRTTVVHHHAHEHQHSNQRQHQHDNDEDEDEENSAHDYHQQTSWQGQDDTHHPRERRQDYGPSLWA